MEQCGRDNSAGNGAAGAFRVRTRAALAARRKAEAVVRVMAGEDAHEVAGALGVSVHEVETWRREFLLAGERRMGELPLGMIERCLSPFERLVPLATLVSVAIAVVLFVQGQHRDREAREKEAALAREHRVAEAYNALDDKYIEYVKLCLQHPDLDVFDTPLPRARPATPEQKRQEGMMFAILFSLFERSYQTYRDQSDDFKKDEWRAWDAYLHRWLDRPNFREEWQRTRDEYDASFRAYLDGRLAETRPASTQPATSPAARAAP